MLARRITPGPRVDQCCGHPLCRYPGTSTSIHEKCACTSPNTLTLVSGSCSPRGTHDSRISLALIIRELLWGLSLKVPPLPPPSLKLLYSRYMPPSPPLVYDLTYNHVSFFLSSLCPARICTFSKLHPCGVGLVGAETNSTRSQHELVSSSLHGRSSEEDHAAGLMHFPKASGRNGEQE